MNKQLPVNQNEIQIMEYFNAYNKVIKLRRAGREEREKLKTGAKEGIIYCLCNFQACTN